MIAVSIKAEDDSFRTSFVVHISQERKLTWTDPDLGRYFFILASCYQAAAATAAATTAATTAAAEVSRNMSMAHGKYSTGNYYSFWLVD